MNVAESISFDSIANGWLSIRFTMQFSIFLVVPYLDYYGVYAVRGFRSMRLIDFLSCIDNIIK